MNPRGIEAVNKLLIEDGFAEGYRDEVFYQMNWDIGVRSRNEIILFGNELKANRDEMIHLANQLKAMRGN